MRTTATLTAILGLALLASAVRAQEHFPSADAAAKAVVAAARAGDADRVIAILGPGSEEIIKTGDPVDDAAALKRFATAAAAKMRVENTSDTLAVIHAGKEDWPMPIPLARDDQGWKFDTAAGKEELMNRRIGRNELTAIAVCRAYVAAQFEYASKFHTYAQTIRSSPGKHDGLYWEASDGDESPLGPLVAEATSEGYKVREADEGPAPYHGYYFKILTSQGSHAPGGARNYIRNDRMTDGFAMVAWPADHGSSGVMTFVVDAQGVVFQKDLGDGTADAAKNMTTYDPDESWMPSW